MPKKNEMSVNVNNSSVQAPLFADETAIVLTKQSNESQVKAYFEGILKLSKSVEDFPVNFDDVWLLVYKNRGDAVRALKTYFIEGVDYKVFSKNAKNLQGGRPLEIFNLSIPCLEYFIARKVRPVFEVYRKVFHKVIKTPAVHKEILEKERMIKASNKQLDEAMKQLSILSASNENLRAQVKTLVELFQEEVTAKVNILTFIEKRRLTEELKAYMA